MDDVEDSGPMTTSETEISELIGMFDSPAFVRRGQDLEHALTRLDVRCRSERGRLLEMVRLRLRQWSAVATGPADREGRFAIEPSVAALIDSGDGKPQAWAAQAATARRRRAVARDLVASVNRFNTRWTAFLDQLNLDPVNQMIEQYNRYYLLEKECVLGSARLALRFFTPKGRVTRESLSERYPSLPVPEIPS